MGKTAASHRALELYCLCRPDCRVTLDGERHDARCSRYDRDSHLLHIGGAAVVFSARSFSSLGASRQRVHAAHCQLSHAGPESKRRCCQVVLTYSQGCRSGLRFRERGATSLQSAYQALPSRLNRPRRRRRQPVGIDGVARRQAPHRRRGRLTGDVPRTCGEECPRTLREILQGDRAINTSPPIINAAPAHLCSVSGSFSTMKASSTATTTLPLSIKATIETSPSLIAL